ncbi:hypothetical protein [Halomonas sp. BC04]|uniref:hypothetical protein n=1 Tax=Halomonas sp. BC04 TaxID=1403540 RepID=UPI0012DCA846|nr:hypothetical protein [Halomonas sp. BC04]
MSRETDTLECFYPTDIHLNIAESAVHPNTPMDNVTFRASPHTSSTMTAIDHRPVPRRSPVSMESTRSIPSITAGANRKREHRSPAEKENASPDINALIMDSSDMRGEYA